MEFPVWIGSPEMERLNGTTGALPNRVLCEKGENDKFVSIGPPQENF
jgi:hypothetical protein